MQHEVTQTPAGKDAQTQGAIIGLLLDDPGCPWSVDELSRAVGDSEVIDSLADLCAAGLVHRCGELVFPTRAAIKANEIID